MQILCLGLSHHTAPLELREQLNFAPADLQAALTRFRDGHAAYSQGIAELTILSTCSRLEVYAVLPKAPASNTDNDPSDRVSFAKLHDFIVENRRLAAATFEPHWYRHVGLQAVEHLCRVAAGLDSMVVGEPQVLGQVAEAHETALEHSATGPVLSALFQAAVRAGKRARTETAISRNAASISSVAVRLTQQIVGALDQVEVLVVGAGEMGQLAVKALRARGVQSIAVANRTGRRAADLAAQWGGKAYNLEQLPDAIRAVDIVITSTDATNTIITPTLVQKVIERRAGRALLFIDIAVPRNVDPAVGKLPGVQLFDMDDLQSELEGSLAERQAEIPLVENIIAAETTAFEVLLKEREALPVIRALRRKAEAIRRQELERTLRHIPDIDPATREHIQHLSKSLVNKLLHSPTTRVRVEAGNGRADQFAAVLRELFDLQDDAPASDDLQNKARG